MQTPANGLLVEEVSGNVNHNLPIAAFVAVFPEVNALPGPERQMAVNNRNRQ